VGRFDRSFGSVLANGIALTVLLAGCATELPSLEGRTPTAALADTSGTRLGRALAPGLAVHAGQTGVHPLPSPRDAFAARGLLAAAADRSLDVQYYIWHGDAAGVLLFEALWRSAERGVRVRLLLDDNNTSGLDPTLAALDAHPNIEVRLYNPFVQRSGRLLSYLTDFQRLNRRMHNKSFTADNRVTIVGGRNIGGEYFGMGSAMVFADLDVLAVGASVGEVSDQFDRYWNSPSAYPAASFVGTAAPDAVEYLEARFAAARAAPEAAGYLEALRTTPLVRDLLDKGLSFEWVTARLLADNPAKTLDPVDRADHLLFPALVQAMGQPTNTLDLVSPYLVPGEQGTESLAALARSGVTVRILTNSLAASDVAAVHAGYTRRRVDLLRAGVRQERRRFGFLVGPAREDLRRRPLPHLRRLVQLRPALGAAEHRDGPGDRQPDSGADVGRQLRPDRAAGSVRGRAGAGRHPPAVDRAQRRRREALRHRARDELAEAHGRRRAVAAADRVAAVARRP
jgi:putative cardiolipin synthase